MIFADVFIVNPIFLSSDNSSVIEAAPQAPPSLPPDKVYVEHKSGFATTPRVKIFRPLNYGREDVVDVENSTAVSTPLELAILVQKCCRPLYTLCHGLLGGMALLHIIMVNMTVLMTLNLIRKSFFGFAKYIEGYEDVQLIISLFTPGLWSWSQKEFDGISRNVLTPTPTAI
jgi:hypothetical protein